MLLQQPINKLAPFTVFDETQCSTIIKVDDKGVEVNRIIFCDGTMLDTANIKLPSNIDIGTF